jgi:hypothetical protein
MAYFSLVVFAGLIRNIDVYNLRSRSCTRVFEDVLKKKQKRRYFKFVSDSLKNDPYGTGPEEGILYINNFVGIIESNIYFVDREHLLPCIFMDNLDRNAKRNFTIQLKSAPFCACPIYACPFSAISAYLEMAPDPYGEEDRDLKFMRAKSTRGERRFINSPLGENSLKKVIPRLNDLLPANLKLKNVFAHSGRHTAASIAVNSGVDPCTVSKVTKHQDPKTLKNYIHEDIGHCFCNWKAYIKRYFFIST